ncbi:hypothetical protein FR483_n073L [Paramecium bursaria Chlorella virus FR483]|uniref:Uncharacterized protein n073L n=1 Tax=Paramecium bursaria Chlorella virus FR483 TaxID=399781 RepID=A7J6C7_PBCVF|nr:hypothetical protein FR483_n073L [Paramecium bursaria Chlorella virus FR483]ABT15358.1 hypothetical protein FR483_n073L [Paramecium bursaria Chlorella virus FR483]
MLVRPAQKTFPAGVAKLRLDMLLTEEICITPVPLALFLPIEIDCVTAQAKYLLVFAVSDEFDNNVKLEYEPFESWIFHRPMKPNPDVLIVGVVIVFPANVKALLPV